MGGGVINFNWIKSDEQPGDFFSFGQSWKIKTGGAAAANQTVGVYGWRYGVGVEGRGGWRHYTNRFEITLRRRRRRESRDVLGSWGRAVHD